MPLWNKNPQILKVNIGADDGLSPISICQLKQSNPIRTYIWGLIDCHHWFRICAEWSTWNNGVMCLFHWHIYAFPATDIYTTNTTLCLLAYWF